MSAEYRSAPQTGSAKQWLGQLVDGLFPLREYLGTDETGALYATEFEGQRAAIKVVPAAGRTAEQLIWRWRLASKVSHPHLIRLWKVGKSQLDGAAVAYVVMECAEENLGQVLSERPLTALEAREMLGPALDAIACFHREGFVHGRLTPGNISAVNDVVKLSSDSLRRAAEVDDLPPLQGAYRPPEVAAGGKPSPAGDIWALGVTLVDVLTQRRPAWTGADKELVTPDGIGEPFLDIIRRCLRPQPQQRCTADDVIELLNASASAPAKSRRWWYAAVPAAVVVIAIVAVWMSRPSTTSKAPPAAPSAAAQAAPSLDQPPSPPPAQAKAETPAPAVSAPAAPDPEPEAAAVASSAPTSPDVVTQVMPEVLDKARRSINGKVNVAVNVHTDAYGTVKDAAIASPRVSRYFSGVALKAVHRWKFRPVKSGDVYAPQDWMVRFEFTRGDTKVQVEHAAP